MSQENVEIVRRAVTEFDESQRLSASFAPDFVLETRTFRGAPGPFEYHGWEGFFEFFREWVDAYDAWEQEIEQILDGGGDRVVVHARQRGRLRGTEDWVELDYGLVYTVTDGLIRRVQVYATLDEALEAAGLRE
jgi:ketosteroid isomerase-like protein